jgi:hypothetical protein
LQYLGVTDPRFNYENFGNQSSSLIFRYLQFYEEAHRNEANQNAITHAIGWSGLFNGFAGKDNKHPVKPEDILPYPSMVKGSEPRVFSPKTFATIIRLMKDRKIPPPVLAFLHAIPEIQQKLIADGTK